MKTQKQYGAFLGLEQGQPSWAAAGHPSTLHHPCPRSPCLVINHALLFVSPPLLCMAAAQSKDARPALPTASSLTLSAGCSRGLRWVFVQLPKASGKIASLSPPLLFSAGWC